MIPETARSQDMARADSADRTLDPGRTIEWIPELRAFARSLTQDVADAEDLVQETLLKAIRHRDKFRAGTNLRAWLFTIMRNTFYNSVRESARTRTGSQDCVPLSLAAPATQEWSVCGDEIVAAINRLPAHYRDILALVVVLGESYESAARVCDCAVGTVKSRVNRARTMVIADLAAPRPDVGGNGDGPPVRVRGPVAVRPS